MPFAIDKSLLHLLRRASQVVSESFNRELGDRDLTPRELIVLSVLEENPGASQTAIVAATGIDRSTLADLVRRLVKRGLLTRKRTREDARAYAVRLTDEGRRVLLKSMPVMAGVDAAALAIIPTKQRSEFIAFLGKIVERGERKDGSGGA